MIIKKNKAFLLMEVLATVLIVSIAVVYINHAFSSSIKSTSLSNSYLDAVMVLENKAYDLEFSALLSGELDSTKKETYNDTDFVSEISISELLKEDIGTEYDYDEKLLLERLNLKLRWDKQGNKRDINILTYAPIIELEE